MTIAWNLPLEKIKSRIPAANPFPRIAIETGTGRGAGTRALSRHFSRVFSIELSPERHAGARQRLAGADYSHVKLLQGNSAELLPWVLKEVPANEPIFFFLDAHWSGDASVDWAAARWSGLGCDTAHLGTPGSRPTGPEQSPLESELQAIVRHCQGEAVILIDDLKNLPAHGPGRRDAEFPGEDWSHLSRAALHEVVSPRLVDAWVLEGPSQWLLVLRSLAIFVTVSLLSCGSSPSSTSSSTGTDGPPICKVSTKTFTGCCTGHGNARTCTGGDYFGSLSGRVQCADETFSSSCVGP